MGEERYEYIGRILESIHPSVTIADGKGRFVYLGKAFKEFAGKGEMAERIKGCMQIILRFWNFLNHV